MSIRDSILPISLDVPSMSPVAHLKFLRAMNAIKNPPIVPPITPITPVMLRAKNPMADDRTSESRRSFLFMAEDAFKNRKSS